MSRKLRTAVLVVHGMGSQRPLETVRGVINAVWFDNDDHSKDKAHKLWSHPEPSGVDLDLTVMTTNAIPKSSDGRSADFHELYWAHHMSETKAVAVLLWLFELGRRGPNFKTGMNGLWWAVAVYLCLMLLSVSLLSMTSIIWLAGIDYQPHKILGVFELMVWLGIAFGLLAALIYRYWKLAVALVVALVALAGIGAWTFYEVDQIVLARWTSCFIVPVLAWVAAGLLMKRRGLIVFAATYGCSLAFFAVILLTQKIDFWQNLAAHFEKSDLPWSTLSHQQSIVAAFCILGIYLLINAAFLQPYLGDAARYFRNSPANVAVRRAVRKDAVDTLDQLHRSRNYDRIVVVAHSLGTIVAYDMLRAYYSRICNQISVDKNKLGNLFDRVDSGLLSRDQQRKQGRQLISEFAAISGLLNDARRQGIYAPAQPEEVDAWLVTDFVTLGSPLTHARYFMSNDDDGDRLDQDFQDQVRERALPTCPPQKLDGDGLIGFTDPNTKVVRLHHGGMFGMTRWTNLYFPIINIFWGDAIGGPMRDVFGLYVDDVPVSIHSNEGTSFFAHVAYWKTTCPEGRNAPHLARLIEAVNLCDA